MRRPKRWVVRLAPPTSTPSSQARRAFEHDVGGQLHLGHAVAAREVGGRWVVEHGLADLDGFFEAILPLGGGWEVEPVGVVLVGDPAPPMPSTARPLESTSRVVMVLARRAGARKVTGVTSA